MKFERFKTNEKFLSSFSICDDCEKCHKSYAGAFGWEID